MHINMPVSEKTRVLLLAACLATLSGCLFSTRHVYTFKFDTSGNFEISCFSARAGLARRQSTNEAKARLKEKAGEICARDAVVDQLNVESLTSTFGEQKSSAAITFWCEPSAEIQQAAEAFRVRPFCAKLFEWEKA